MNISYGYSLENGKIVPNKTEQMAIKVIRLLKKEGLSLNEIALVLESKGFIAQNRKQRCEYSCFYMVYPNIIRFFFNE